MVAVLNSVIYQLISHTTFIGKLWYLNMLIFRLLIIITVGCGIYADEQSNFICLSGKEVVLTECYDNYTSSNQNPNIVWTFQIIFSCIPIALFHSYLSDVDNKILRISSLKHDIKKIYEAEELPLNAAAKVRNKKLLLRQLKKHVGDYKYRLMLQGARPVEVVHSKRILLANLTHLAVRFTIEILTIVLITRMYQPQYFKYNVENDEKESIDQFFHVPVKREFLCKYHFTHKCFIPRAHEKSQFLTYMNLMAFIAVSLTLCETFFMIVKNRNRYRRHRIQTRYENCMRMRPNIEHRTRQEESSSGNNNTTSGRPEQTTNDGRDDTTRTSHPDVRQPQRNARTYVEARISPISRDESEPLFNDESPPPSCPRYSTLHLNQL